MPVQINEIIVRTVVDTQPSSAAKPSEPDNSPGGVYAQEELLERLLEIINESKER